FYDVCLHIIYNFRKLVILKCKTIFYATCHLLGEFFFADVDALWSLKRSFLLVRNRS
ncbi:unnamed protein product, partial [Brassica oleracea var. botrytis]